MADHRHLLASNSEEEDQRAFSKDMGDESSHWSHLQAGMIEKSLTSPRVMAAFRMAMAMTVTVTVTMGVCLRGHDEVRGRRGDVPVVKGRYKAVQREDEAERYDPGRLAKADGPTWHSRECECENTMMEATRTVYIQSV